VNVSAFITETNKTKAKKKNTVKNVKVDKKLNNNTIKYIRPLPVPGNQNKKVRGGRQARAMKKKFGMSEIRKRRNRPKG